MTGSSIGASLLVRALSVHAGLARSDTGNDDIRASAMELYFGARTLGHMEGARANLGAGIVAGWSRLGAGHTRGSLALGLGG